MPGLDGLYSFASTTTTWDDSGLVISRGAASQRVPWSAVTRVRIRRGDGRGQSVQLLPRQRVTAAGAAEPLTIPVSSDADANRLATTFDEHVHGPGLIVDDLI